MTDDESEYASIVISAEGVAEYEGRRRAIFVPRAEVTELRVTRASVVNRPWVSVVLGVAVTVASLFVPLWGLVIWAREGGTYFVKWLTMAAFSIAGIYLIWSGLRKRLIVVVRTPKGIRRLAFQGEVDPEEATAFVQEAGGRFGYMVAAPPTSAAFGIR